MATNRYKRRFRKRPELPNYDTSGFYTNTGPNVDTSKYHVLHTYGDTVPDAWALIAKCVAEGREHHVIQYPEDGGLSVYVKKAK